MFKLSASNGGIPMPQIDSHIEGLKEQVQSLPGHAQKVSDLPGDLRSIAAKMAPGASEISKSILHQWISNSYEAIQSANSDTLFKRLQGRSPAELDRGEIENALQDPVAATLLASQQATAAIAANGGQISDELVRGALEWGAGSGAKPEFGMLESYLLVQGLADRDLTPAQADMIAKGAVTNYAYYPSGGKTDNTLGFRVLSSVSTKANIDTLLDVINAYPRGVKVVGGEAQREALLSLTVNRPDVTAVQLDKADMQPAGNQQLQLKKNALINERRKELGLPEKPYASPIFTR